MAVAPVHRYHSKENAMMESTDNDLHLGTWLAAAAAGALVMYMLDPDYGAPRRAASDRKLRELGEESGKAVNNRVEQIGSGAERAGTRLGGTLGSVAREAGQALKGIAERELGTVTSGSAQGDGTDRSETDWQERSRSDRPLSQLPALQGANGLRPASGLRMTALAGGGLLGLFGLLAPRSLLSTAAGLAGIALLARASSRRPLHTMIGTGSHARPVDVERTVQIDAAPEQVFDQFSQLESFPQFMANVVQVRDLGKGRSHWTVKGPGGTEFTWTSTLTEYDRPHRLAWRSEPGAEIDQHGTVQFEPMRGGTRVTVRLAYKPPAGAVGHAVARLLGKDPGRELEEDLAQMKMLVERKLAHAAGNSTGSTSSLRH
jgi:uncharacterized membrane protein